MHITVITCPVCKGEIYDDPCPHCGGGYHILEDCPSCMKFGYIGNLLDAEMVT